MEKGKDSYSFKLGDLECLAVSDTKSPMDLNMLFSPVKPRQMERMLRKHDVPAGEIMEVICLLIRMRKRIILIDTGWGAGWQPGSGCLVPVLRANGIQPGDIDTVIISHGHPDHIGGNTDSQGKASFPNARYVMHIREWEFWTSGPEQTVTDPNMIAYVQKNMVPLKDRFELVDDNIEIAPGIKFISAPGHSPFHCMLEISSNAEKLLYISDMMHHPVQVPCPDFYVFADSNHEQAIRTRKDIIQKASSTGILIFACHFPFPGLGHIMRKDDAFLWQPVKTEK